MQRFRFHIRDLMSAVVIAGLSLGIIREGGPWGFVVVGSIGSGGALAILWGQILKRLSYDEHSNFYATMTSPISLFISSAIGGIASSILYSLSYDRPVVLEIQKPVIFWVEAAALMGYILYLVVLKSRGEPPTATLDQPGA